MGVSGHFCGKRSVGNMLISHATFFYSLVCLNMLPEMILNPFLSVIKSGISGETELPYCTIFFLVHSSNVHMLFIVLNMTLFARSILTI